MKRFLAVCISAASLLGAGVKAEPVAAYRLLAEQDLRLATVGYRLAVANAPFCGKRRGFNPGWVLHDVAQYPDEIAAGKTFGFADPVQISAVVPGSDAAKAGLAPGDGLAEIGERKVAELGQSSKPNDDRIRLVRQIAEAAWQPSREVRLRINRGSASSRVQFQSDPVCASDFWVDVKDSVDAGADGDRVRVTLGLMQFADDDDQLAAVVAHEFAHNILGHRARLDQVKRGKTKAVLATEVEADRLSIWLMANAGYDPAAALRFAERFGRKYGLGIFSDGTHMRWKNRVRTMQSEISLIAQTPERQGKRAFPLLTDR